MRSVYDEGAYVRNDAESAFHCILLESKKKGIISRAHFHNYIEILYGVSCDFNVWVNDESFRITDGDLIVIHSGETHLVRTERHDNLYYVIKFSPDILKNDTCILQEIDFLCPISGNRLITKEVVSKTRIDQIIQQIYEEWARSEPGYELALRGGNLMLWAQIVRLMGKGCGYGGPRSEAEKTIYRAVNYCREHFSDVTEEELARRFCMSYSYFSRMFKKVMKKNYTDFIGEQRLDHARQLLLTTSQSITEIAHRTGFSSSSHFISYFKKFTGYSPLAYRRRLIEEENGTEPLP